MNSLVHGTLPYLPILIIGIVILALLAIAGVIWLVSLSVKSAAKKKLAQGAAPEGAGPVVEGKLKWYQRFWAALQRFWHYIKIGNKNAPAAVELGASFSEALGVLQDSIGGKNYSYQVPWFLMIGATNSGKSTIANSLRFDLPITNPLREPGSPNPALEWWFFDQGLVLDVRGDAILNSQSSASEHRNWDLLLALLSRHRPKRPLDGIVLTIPCDELIGRKRLTSEEWHERAKHLHGKIWLAQKKLGMRLPIYVLVTKCDVLTGFIDFVNHLPIYTHQQIFGWSNPYPLDQAYSEHWLEEAFSSIHNELGRAQQAVMIDGNVGLGQSSDALFSFPLEFAHLANGLKVYLEQIFSTSAYHESFFFRGLYFCGEQKRSLSQLSPNLKAIRSTMATQVSDGELKAFSHEREENRPYLRVTKEHSHSQLVFVRDLFSKKIFREFGVARPIFRILRSTNRLLNIAKVVTSVIFAIWFLGVASVYTSLREKREQFTQTLVGISHLVNQSSAVNAKARKEGVKNSFDAESRAILSGIGNTHASGFFSLFLPASWFSTIGDKKFQLFKFTYNQIIIKVIEKDLKANLLKAVQRPHLDKNAFSSQALHPLGRPSFSTLLTYVNNLEAIEQSIQDYNSLPRTKNPKILNTITKSLYNYVIPETIFHSYAMDQSIESIAHSPIDLEPYKSQARGTFIFLADSFVQDAIEPATVFNKLDKVMTLLSVLRDRRGGEFLDEATLQKLTSGLVQTIDFMTNPDIGWLDSHTFEPGVAYNQLIIKAKGTNLLGNKAIQTLNDHAAKKFKSLKEGLGKYATPLTGAFFTQQNGEYISQPSMGLRRLFESFGSLINEPFMAQIEEETELQELDFGVQALLWDQLLVNQAVELLKSYQVFVSKKLLLFQSNLRDLMRVIALNGAQRNIKNLLVKAQVVQADLDSMPGSVAYQRNLEAMVQNIQSVTQQFAQLLPNASSQDTQIMAQLRNLLINHGLSILQRIDQELEAEELYKLSSFDTTFQSIQGMQEYITSQRSRLLYLGNVLAEPTLHFLNTIYGAHQADRPYLYDKWMGINQILTDYQKKTPGNLLLQLEFFIQHPENDLPLDGIESGYFLELFEQLKSQFNAQRTSMTMKQAREKYNNSADLFNQLLAGRFPFVDLGEPYDGEADPEDVATFYKLYEELPEASRTALVGAIKEPQLRARVSKFFEETEGVKALFKSYIAKDPEQPVPVFDFNVQFRVNRDFERGGQGIIEWSLQNGTQKINWRDEKQGGRWRFSQPVSLTLRWAANSSVLPLPDHYQPDLSTEGLTARFTYTGKWGLLGLMRKHAASAADFVQYKDTTPYTLKFTIPLKPAADAKSAVAQEPAVVFIRVNLMSPKKGGGAVPMPVSFPRLAPNLDSKALSTSIAKQATHGK